MKNRNGFKIVLLSLAGAAAFAGMLVGPSGCVTRQTVTSSTNNATGVVTDVTNVSTTVDPAKLADVETAIEPVVAGAARRVLQNSPQHADEIASYLRSVGRVFCDMQSSGQFDPEFLIDATDQIVSPKLPDDYVVDIKNAAIAVYKIAWGDRFKAELPAAQWTGEVCKLICNSLNTGLKDAGKAGIPTASGS